MEKFISIQRRGDKGTKWDGRDLAALGAGREERVPSRALLYFCASPWGWLCPGSTETRRGVAQGRKPPRSCCCGGRGRTG